MRRFNKRGGVDQFKGLIVGFVLFTLFTFLIITFVTNVAQENGLDTTEFEEGAFSLDPYENVLDSVESDAETFRERFERGSIFSVVAGIVVTGIFGIAIDMIVLVISPFTLLGQVMTNVLGIPIIVTSVVLGIIILSIIFGIWSVIKKGD